jgi:hypothetical protein
MNEADVLVTVEGGVADVDVRKPNVMFEIRDYNVDGLEDDHERLWTDERGDRYVVTHDITAPADPQKPAEPPIKPTLGG